MEVFVLGATGYIGTVVSEALAEEHEVVGLARSDESARELEDAGHRTARGDVRSPESVVGPARDADAVVYLAHTGDGDAGEVDHEAVEAILDTLEGTAKPFLYTSGCWVLGDTGEEVADEEYERDPAEVVAWRAPLEDRILDAAGQDVASVVIRPSMVYGRNGGIPGLLVDEAEESGTVRVVEDGFQEWPMVHVEDLADLYVRALDAEGGSLYNAVSGPSYRARDVAVAAGVAAGTDGSWEPWSLAEVRDELGGFGMALSLSQRMTAARARQELGWEPRAPTLMEELLRGSYRRD